MAPKLYFVRYDQIQSLLQFLINVTVGIVGFSQIISEESDVNIKNQMLEYLSDLMEDLHDFGWPAAKGCHSVLSVQMEQGKVEWSNTQQIDRIRGVHAQRSGVGNSNFSRKIGRDRKPVPCKFYQKLTCGQKQEHENLGLRYLLFLW